MRSRELLIHELKQNPTVSVLIAGGGINGIGVYRDLALQGVDVVLIERGDFCGGTSAASTRVIHGGLRYLENGEFRLVREALKERTRLLNNAPHYVRPLPMTIPLYDWTSGMVHAARTFFNLGGKPGQRGAAIIKIGLTLYDWFAGRDNPMPKHTMYTRQQSLERRPQLDPKIVSTATFYDARIHYPERLGLELIADAEAEANQRAIALNYVSLDSASGDTVTLRDEISGETLVVQPKIVINATGAWIDFTNTAMSHPTRYIGGTKGSHIVINQPELFAAADGQMMYFVNADARVCIFYPFEDRIIAGATDIPVDNPDDAICDADETAYLLDSISQVFPNITVTEDDVVFRFCGVRPLPRSDALTAGQISRDHSVRTIEAGQGTNFPIYSLIGGKWTTYRAFAEQVTDQVLAALKRGRVATTENLPIGGGRDFPMTEQDRVQWLAGMHIATGISPDRMAVLLSRYGTRAEQVAETICTGTNDAPLQHLPDYSQREVEFLIHNERVARLDDLLLRRTLIGFLGRLTPELLDELVVIMANVLNWSDVRRRAEVNRTRSLFRERHGVNL